MCHAGSGHTQVTVVYEEAKQNVPLRFHVLWPRRVRCHAYLAASVHGGVLAVGHGTIHLDESQTTKKGRKMQLDASTTVRSALCVYVAGSSERSPRETRVAERCMIFV